MRRRGWSLPHLLGALIVVALLMGMAMPLFLQGVRRADEGRARSTMLASLREASFRMGQDVRQSGRVDASAARILLTNQAGRRITYRQDGPHLAREETGAAPALFSGVTFRMTGPKDGDRLNGTLTGLIGVNSRLLTTSIPCRAQRRGQ